MPRHFCEADRTKHLVKIKNYLGPGTGINRVIDQGPISNRAIHKKWGNRGNQG